MISFGPWTIPPQDSSPPISERAPAILVLDGPAGLASQITPALQSNGYELIVRSTVDGTTKLLQEVDPDLLLIDMSLKDPSGFEVCSEVRTTEAGRAMPIVLISAMPVEDSEIARGLMCGADDFLVVHDRLGEFQARIRVQLRNKRERDRSSRLQKERDAYRQEAVVDPLTGIPNRRAIGSRLARLVAASSPFTLLFLDVDHFKRVNDSFGHEVGDHVLKAVAACLRQSIRTGDCCGRYGGEEFVVGLAGVAQDEALAIAEQYRGAFEHLEIPAVRHLTVSIGVAVFNPQRPDPSVDALVARADAALYEAKRLGRNRVALAAPNEGSAIATPGIKVERAGAGDVRALEEALLRELATGRTGLPLLPAAATQALRLAQDPHTNMAEIAQLVERDPPLAARFIAVARSALYSRGAKLVTMQAALVRIGLASARDLLLQVVYERTNAELPRYRERVAHSFEHSVRTAIATRSVAQETRGAFEDAYLCGLLHDIGEARIYRILSTMPAAPDSGAIVDDLVARHHARAGADVARAWKLPGEIINVCMHHHEDPEKAAPTVRIVLAAEALVRALDQPPADPAAPPPPVSLPEEDMRIVERSGVRAQRVAHLLSEIGNQMAQYRDV